MADHGFMIADDVAFYQAKLVILDFTKGKKQLHPLEVENTRKIASVRIHVERVIGLVVRKRNSTRISQAKARRDCPYYRQSSQYVLCFVMLVPTHRPI